MREMPGKKIGTKKIKLNTLKLNKRNPRRISDGALDSLCKSIKRDPHFMELRPIIVDKQNIIIGGTQRYRACVKLGRKEVPASWVHAALNLTEKQRQRFILVDNAPEGMSGYWDWDILNLDFDVPELEKVGFVLPEKIDFEKMWEGMPEFEGEDQTGYQKITVHFETREDVIAFAKLVKRKIIDSTRYLWFPERPNEPFMDKRYDSES